VSTRIGLLAYRPVSTQDFAHDFSAPAPEFSGETDSLAEEDGFELAVPPRRERLWGSAFPAAASD
jgi:hypothetical protein